MGLPAIYPVSAEHGRGIGDLLDALVAQFPPSPLAPSHQGRGSSIDSPLPSWEGVGGRGELRVAVVGRPNVGKSTFINTLVGDERVVVDATAGTTRDTIDVRWKYKDQDFLFVDTAGVKKKNVVTSRLEKFSVMKTLASIERSHIVCLLIDAFEGLTRQDLHLAQFAWEAGRGLILLANKWDLVTVPWRFETLQKNVATIIDGPVESVAGRFAERTTAAIGQGEASQIILRDTDRELSAEFYFLQQCPQGDSGRLSAIFDEGTGESAECGGDSDPRQF